MSEKGKEKKDRSSEGTLFKYETSGVERRRVVQETYEQSGVVRLRAVDTYEQSGVDRRTKSKEKKE